MNRKNLQMKKNSRQTRRRFLESSALFTAAALLSSVVKRKVFGSSLLIDNINKAINPLIIDPGRIFELLPGVWIIPDPFIFLVPNIGIIEGEKSVLVFETGLGPKSGEAVLRKAKEIAGKRKLILTLSHFHPEHGYGAQAFKGVAKIIYNQSQRDELRQKGSNYLKLFNNMPNPQVAEALAGTQITEPDEVYSGFKRIDLGGRIVELLEVGLSHTKGDQLVWLPKERVVFSGDLLEAKIFPIFPYYPPDDIDVNGNNWIDTLRRIRSLNPVQIVPGHGKLGGTELLDIAENYLLNVGSKVKMGKNQGKTEDELVSSLKTEIFNLHPDWRDPQFVELCIRSFYHTDFLR